MCNINNLSSQSDSLSLLLKCRFSSIPFQVTISVLGEKVILKTFDKNLVRMRPCQEGSMNISCLNFKVQLWSSCPYDIPCFCWPDSPFSILCQIVLVPQYIFCLHTSRFFLAESYYLSVLHNHVHQEHWGCKMYISSNLRVNVSKIIQVNLRFQVNFKILF